MGRAPCCDKANVKKGPWSPDEDGKLKEYIDKNGTGGNWITLPQKAGLKRCGKSCRLRWLNYLRPNIKHGEFSDKEDRIICTLFSSIGSRWSIIAGQLPGRTDNDIKNYWNTKLKKKLMGLMPPNNYSSSQKTPLHVINCYPSPPPSSSSSPLSVADVASYDQISIPSNSTVIQCHDYEGYVGHMGNIYQVKESALMFGGGTEASCSTSASSGGSLSTQSQSYLFNGVDHHENYQNLMISNCGYYEKPDGLCVESGVEYSNLEEIKQLISTNFCNFLVDENKADENVVYF